MLIGGDPNHLWAFFVFRHWVGDTRVCQFRGPVKLKSLSMTLPGKLEFPPQPSHEPSPVLGELATRLLNTSEA